MCARHGQGEDNPDWSLRTRQLTHLQQFEYFIKDVIHVWKEGHTMERYTAVGKGALGMVPSPVDGLALTWHS